MLNGACEPNKTEVSEPLLRAVQQPDLVLGHLAALTGLTSLAYGRAYTPTQAWVDAGKAIAQLTRLRELRLLSPHEDNHLTRLSALTRLTSLALTGALSGFSTMLAGTMLE